MTFIFCFFSGKILENLSLGPNNRNEQNQQQQQQQHTPPSQPPTPPSTPLSPKTNELNKYTSSSNLPTTIPNLTITQTSSPSNLLPQNLSKTIQKTPLNLGKRTNKESLSSSSSYSNGNTTPNSSGHNNYGSGGNNNNNNNGGSGGLNLSINSDYPYQMDFELLRSKMVDEKTAEKICLNNTRVSFNIF